jgi:hypothetical protein
VGSTGVDGGRSLEIWGGSDAAPSSLTGISASGFSNGSSGALTDSFTTCSLTAGGLATVSFGGLKELPLGANAGAGGGGVSTVAVSAGASTTGAAAAAALAVFLAGFLVATLGIGLKCNDLYCEI